MVRAERLKGRVALVTGAGSGIGRATARRFADEGAIVIGTDIAVPAASETAAIVGTAGAFLPQDAASEADWSRIESEIRGRFGRLDILFNNAGTSGPADPETCTLAEWRRVMAVNLDGVFLGCRAGIALMKERGGAIVNVSSCAAYGGFPLSVHYGASKTAVRQFTKSVALHCAQKGYAIRCNSIHPGPTMTGLMKASIARAPSEAEGRARWMAQTPIGRFAEPEEMASLVTWLVSDEATYVTGAEFVSDGGMTAGMGAG